MCAKKTRAENMYHREDQTHLLAYIPIEFCCGNLILYILKNIKLDKILKIFLYTYNAS